MDDDNNYDHQYDYIIENGPAEDHGEHLDFPGNEHYYRNKPLEHHERYGTQSGLNGQHYYYQN